MKVTQITKKKRVTKDSIIKYQILTHCHFEDIVLSQKEVDALVSLAKSGKMGLNDFCLELSDNGVFETPQSARNAVGKLVTKQLIKKAGTSRKTVEVAIDIESAGSLLVNYNLLYIDTQEA